MKAKQFVLPASLFVAISSVSADEIEHPFSISAGGLWNDVDATFVSTLDGRDPVELDFDNLGMDNRATVFWAEGTWRFARRWTANLSYSSFSSDGFAEAQFDGNYGDVDWEAGASLDSSFGIDLAIASVTWDFYQGERTRAGIGLGVHTAGLDFDITARAQVETSEGIFEEVAESAGRNVLAPLPNLAVSASHEFSDKLRLVGYAGVFSLSVDKYDGALVSSRVAMEWFPWENFGIGGAVQYLDAKLDIERANRLDEFEVEFFGPIAYATYRF
jgi:hypothetical protein